MQTSSVPTAQTFGKTFLIATAALQARVQRRFLTIGSINLFAPICNGVSPRLAEEAFSLLSTPPPETDIRGNMFLKSFLLFLLLSGRLAARAEEQLTIPSSWTEAEKRAWESIRSGNLTDLGPAPSASDHNEQQTLTSQFLVTILTNPRFTKAIEGGQVQIKGAYLKNSLDLDNAEVPVRVALESCFIDSGFHFYHATIDKKMQLIFTTFKGPITISNSTFRDSLSIQQSHVSRVEGNFSQFAEVSILQLPVGTISFAKCDIHGPVTLSNIFDSLALVDCKADQLASFQGDFNNLINLTGTFFGFDLDLSAATFRAQVNLESSEISRALILATEQLSCDWKKDSSLKLIDTNVRFIRDSINSWPSKLELNGFVYKRWRNESGEENYEFGRRDLHSFFLRWLKRQDDYSPEPYNQLATALRAVGQPDKAQQVLFASKERERHESLTGLRKLFSWLSFVVIGHGYHYEYSLYWCTGFVALGTFLIIAMPEGRMIRWHNPDFNFFDFFCYSLDAFLPFVKLRNRFGELDFHSPLRYYFYFHRLAGYIVGFFIVAGLTGITK